MKCVIVAAMLASITCVQAAHGADTFCTGLDKAIAKKGDFSSWAKAPPDRLDRSYSTHTLYGANFCVLLNKASVYICQYTPKAGEHNIALTQDRVATWVWACLANAQRKDRRSKSEWFSKFTFPEGELSVMTSYSTKDGKKVQDVLLHVVGPLKKNR
jgi:hypothetical protein